jgi:AcrR family transcriptional regulator
MARSTGTADRVVATAAELFLQKGFQEVSMDRIAEAAGITKVTVYQHFKTKEALLLECLRWRIERREAALNALEISSRGEEDAIAGIFDWTAENAIRNGFSGCAFLKATHEVATRHPAVREVTAEAKALMRDRCVRLASQLGCEAPAELGQMWALLLDGAHLLSMVELSVSPFEVARRHALQTLHAARKAA